MSTGQWGKFLRSATATAHDGSFCSQSKHVSHLKKLLRNLLAFWDRGIGMGTEIMTNLWSRSLQRSSISCCQLPAFGSIGNCIRISCCIGGGGGCGWCGGNGSCEHSNTISGIFCCCWWWWWWCCCCWGWGCAGDDGSWKTNWRSSSSLARRLMSSSVWKGSLHFTARNQSNELLKHDFFTDAQLA